MITYVNTVLVSNLATGTLLGAAPAAAVSMNTPSADAGKFIIENLDANAADKYAVTANTQKIRIGIVTKKNVTKVDHKTGAIQYLPIIKWSNAILKNDIKSYNKLAAASASNTEDTVAINFAGLSNLSGLIGHFNSLIFKVDSISVGASGAIIGLCGNFVIYFLLNYKYMSERKRYTYGSMFFFLFINLFSGLSEGGKDINMAAHIGGFIGGFAVSIILTYKTNYRMQNNHPNLKRLYICSIVFLVVFPIISIASLYYRKVSNIADYICQFKNNKE